MRKNKNRTFTIRFLSFWDHDIPYLLSTCRGLVANGSGSVTFLKGRSSI